MSAPYFAKPEYAGVVWPTQADGLIIDIGANRGQSISAFKRFKPLSRIAAFEPEPASAERLKTRFERDQSVSIFAMALGAKTGGLTFFVPTYGWWNCDGMAATTRQAATEWLSDPGRMYRFDKTKLTVTEHEVECRTLDSFAMSPTLIKLHAQGAELEILQGAECTLGHHKPALMCAFASPEISRFVSNFGYRPYIFCNSQFEPGLARRPVTFTWYLTNEHERLVPTTFLPVRHAR
jgi:FkbM family methyltransferase